MYYIYTYDIHSCITYILNTLMYYTYNYDIHPTPGNVNICSIGSSMRTDSWFVKNSMTFRTHMTRNTYVDNKICSHGIPKYVGNSMRTYSWFVNKFLTNVYGIWYIYDMRQQVDEPRHKTTYT